MSDFQGSLYSESINDWNGMEIAVMDGNIKLVKEYLTRGYNVNHEQEKDSLLMMASLRGNLDIVKLLIQYKANVNYRDKWGTSALFNATTLCSSPEVVKILLENGADVNASAIDKITPLSMAVANGNVAIVKLLLQYKADVNIRNINGGTALSEAINRAETIPVNVNDYKVIIKLLKEAGATI